MAAPDLSVRDAADGDVPRILEIYRHYVLHATCTFEVDPPSEHEMRARVAAVRALGLPWLVAESAGEVVGYAYAGRYRERPAYRHTVENSVYIAHDRHRLGAGRRLLEELVRRITAGHFLQMVAVIGDSRNLPSIALHERVGFRHVGVLQDVGFKHGRWLDTVLMQRTLY
jgi:phosphinothricin acetyltransferase